MSSLTEKKLHLISSAAVVLEEVLAFMMGVPKIQDAPRDTLKKTTQAFRNVLEDYFTTKTNAVSYLREQGKRSQVHDDRLLEQAWNTHASEYEMPEEPERNVISTRFRALMTEADKVLAEFAEEAARIAAEAEEKRKHEIARRIALTVAAQEARQNPGCSFEQIAEALKKRNVRQYLPDSDADCIAALEEANILSAAQVAIAPPLQNELMVSVRVPVAASSTSPSTTESRSLDELD